MGCDADLLDAAVAAAVPEDPLRAVEDGVGLVARVVVPAARAEADTFGIRCGITVPVVRGSGSLAAMTFVTDIKHLRYRSCILRNEVAFQFLAQHSHERLQRLKQSSYTMNGIAFTRREHECLEWASRGKSRRDIAVITGLSFRQVVRDLERAKAKLGVRTTTQAVKIYAADKVNRGIL